MSPHNLAKRSILATFLSFGVAYIMALKVSAGESTFRGDLNLDGLIDFNDIEPFILALEDASAWRQRYDSSQSTLLAVADQNEDGAVNSEDIPGIAARIGVHISISGSSAANAQAAANLPDLIPVPAAAFSRRAADPSLAVIVLDVDLDIDSDNTAGTLRPQRNAGEDTVEDFAEQPGKIALVNDDDDDSNGSSDLSQSGTNTAERGDLVPLYVRLPGSESGLIDRQYRLSIPNTLRIWRSANRGSLSPGSPDYLNTGQLYSYSVRPKGDANCNNVLNVADIGPFVLAVTDPAAYATQFPGCDLAISDMDDNGVVSVGDIGLFVAMVGEQVPLDFVPLLLWVEGLSQSSSAGDARIILESDIDASGSFGAGEIDAVRCSSVRFTASPNAGPLGTVVQLTLTPAINPAAFSSTTSCEWTGRFVPTSGGASNDFTLVLAASSVLEESASSAKIIYGSGTTGETVAFSASPGFLDGHLQMINGSFRLERRFTYLPTGTEGFARITRLDTAVTVGPPSLGPTVTSLTCLDISDNPDVGNRPPNDFDFYYHFHYVPFCTVAESATTTAMAPVEMRIDVVAYTSAGIEIDRLSSIPLLKQLSDPDPSQILYHSDLTKPLVLVDYPIDRALYPSVLLLRFPANGAGKVAILPHH